MTTVTRLKQNSKYSLDVEYYNYCVAVYNVEIIRSQNDQALLERRWEKYAQL
jgi:hypothetical protein